jgi:hypothetical protein
VMPATRPSSAGLFGLVEGHAGEVGHDLGLWTKGVAVDGGDSPGRGEEGSGDDGSSDSTSICTPSIAMPSSSPLGSGATPGHTHAKRSVAACVTVGGVQRLCGR